jgi:hypothetical protein
MSKQPENPTRVSMSLGSTSRNGGEFEFKKISLSLERDLAPAENPIDAYRDIKALLERMVSEFQGSKPAGTSTPAGNGNRGVAPRPAASKLPVLQERLSARLQDLEITDGIDGFIVKPRRYLDDAWAEINEVVRALGGHWQKGQTSRDRSWRIPK